MIKPRRHLPILQTLFNSLFKLCLLAAVLIYGSVNAWAKLNDLAGSWGRPYGDVKVLSTVPMPVGLPEGIAVRGNKVYVSGPAGFGTTGNGRPSEVYEFDINTGELTALFPTKYEDFNQEHANSCIAFDGNGRLYVNNIQLGIYRLDPGTGQQEQYSTPFPNLPKCDGVLNSTPCAPTVVDSFTALPNDIVFDSAGNAYITDSLQATIWKVPAGGGEPHVWFQDSRLDSPYVGVNGLRLDPTGQTFYLSVTFDFLGNGWIYTLPLKDNPTAADLKPFHHYSAGEGPDGIAFGRSGNLYVALATPMKSGISVLNPSGVEVSRLGNQPTSPVWPYDSPANIAFNKHGSLLATNHAFATMIPSHFTVLDVYVGDQEGTIAKPMIP